jgi:hypothetical protein
VVAAVTVKRPTPHAFDVERFIGDVNAYAARWKLTRWALLSKAGLNHQSAYAVLRGDRSPSLLTVCALAEVCDLSLDRYRLPLSTYATDDRESVN